MVRDLILDIKEHDLTLEDVSDSSTPVFDSVWGNLTDYDVSVTIPICNILIPQDYWDMIERQGTEVECHFRATYYPSTSGFKIRLLKMADGDYEIFNNFDSKTGYNAYTATASNIASPISACYLPCIDIDGEFIVKILQNDQNPLFSRAQIYSGKSPDIKIDFSDHQASQLLSICSPGKSYRYPTTGIGVSRYLNSVIDHSNLEKVLKTQFQADNKPLQNAEFDNQTCHLDVVYSPEPETEDEDLVGVDELDFAFFNDFTDQYAHETSALTSISEFDFINALNKYSSILDILLFNSESIAKERIEDDVVDGLFNAEGEIINSSLYKVVSGTVEADTIIMFDDEMECEFADNPLFIVNGIDVTEQYISLIDQPYWISESCHKCMLIKKKATIKYAIRNSQWESGKGLFVIPTDTPSFQNMLALVQDEITGNVLGVVSDNSNVSSVARDEITQYIYALVNNQ